jgi:isochorismate hydrolase
MGIPPISPYPMPTQDDLPDNTAGWRVDPDRAVLLVHDMQKYFLAPFPGGTSPVTELVANVAALRRRCAELGVPVAYTAQPGGMTEADRGLLKDFWGPGMAVHPEHREVVEPVAPRPGDRVFTKWRYSAFHRSGLAAFLRESGRDQLVVCGVYAHVGVLMTACDAFTNDVEAFLVADAVADFSEDYHRLALRWAAERCAVTPTTGTVLEWLDAAPGPVDREARRLVVR